MRYFYTIALSIFFCSYSWTQDSRIQELLEEYNTDTVQTLIKQLSGELPIFLSGEEISIESRLYNNPGNENTFGYCRQLLSSWGYTIEQQKFSTYGKNLFAIKTGTLFPERVCIIGAHYDDIPTGSIAPGADDNASGVAAVLEIARIISTSKFPNTIVFALWDEEELGLIGSSAYTEGTMHGESLLGYINLDMIGWDGNNDHKSELHVRPIGNSLSLASIVLMAQKDYNIDLEIEVVNPGSVNTDHYSFWKEQLTAIGINEEYSGDFNPYYHSSSDIFSELNLPYLDENIKLALVSFSSFAYSISTDEALEHLLVYPNPSSDEIHLDFGSSINSLITIKIVDNTGRILLSETKQDTHDITLDIRHIESGSYILFIEIEGKEKTYSIVKS